MLTNTLLPLKPVLTVGCKQNDILRNIFFFIVFFFSYVGSIQRTVCPYMKMLQSYFVGQNDRPSFENLTSNY